MFKYFIKFFVLANLLVLTVKARQEPIKTYEIKTDTATQSFVLSHSYIQRLDDPTGKLTIANVVSPSIGAKFYSLKRDYEPLLKNIHYYWIRVHFKNTMNKPARLMLYAHWGFSDFYFQLPGKKLQKQTTGPNARWDDRDGYKRYLSVYVEIPAGSEATLYRRAYYDSYTLNLMSQQKISVGLTMGYFDSFANAIITDSTGYYLSERINAMMAGFLVLAGLINLMFYRLIKDKVYLYFSIALIATGIYLGNLPEDVFFANHPILLRYFGSNLLTAILLFSLWLFINAFFEFHKIYPKIAKLITIVASIFAVSEFFLNFFHRLTDVSSIFSIIYCTSVSIIIFTCLVHPKIRSRKKAFTILPIIVAIVYMILNSLSENFFGKSFNSEHQLKLFWLCICWLILSFSWTLLQRLLKTIKESEAEKSELIQQQNVLLETKVNERTAELKSSMDNLQTTQRQLIQAEKMASLGELTAGIAHEIQNPLNFINNFSEVSTELIGEMNDELKAGNIEEGLSIAADLETNLQKINTHGKRADAIVKGMLQHSRVSSGKKEPADINALCDEYLRLSYHGLRAKDKTFNATLETNYALELPKLDLAVQEMGRVILNLFTNAFYSVTEKKKQQPEFEPKVTISTVLEDDYVVIKVKDNGMGIPQTVIDKIYQPFFTTKPTGQGTGLGLSLSYDIITKMHNGKLDVDTKEDEFAEFTIKLPV